MTGLDPSERAPETTDSHVVGEKRKAPESEGAKVRLREMEGEKERMRERMEKMQGEMVKMQSKMERMQSTIVAQKTDINIHKAKIETQAAKISGQAAKIDAQATEIVELKESKGKYVDAYNYWKKRAEGSEHELEKTSKVHKHTSEQQDQLLRATENELTQTRELMSARATELSAAQSFLSTADRLPEADVLGIVRNLNENIFQVAANLTEEWERLKERHLGRYQIFHKDIESFSQAFGYPLISQANRRKSTAVTFLIQACLCDSALNISSNWRHNERFNGLNSAYQGISTSEGQAISARWRALTYSHLPNPPSHSEAIAHQVANVLWITGIFRAPRYAFDFVKKNGFSRIETINELATRLEAVFMVDITSCDMSLLFENPCNEFDEKRMTNEFESGGDSTPGRKDRVAGTIEVGVEKCVYGRGGEGRQTEVLLKAKVVLERDVEGL